MEIDGRARGRERVEGQRREEKRESAGTRQTANDLASRWKLRANERSTELDGMRMINVTEGGS